jgi:hypothetical protein
MLLLLLLLLGGKIDAFKNPATYYARKQANSPFPTLPLESI